MTTTINDSVYQETWSFDDEDGRGFAGNSLPLLVIALKRNGAYAGNI